MIRVYTDVPKRARNSIDCQIGKLIKRYGPKATRLVVMKRFEDISKEMKLLSDIEAKQIELGELKKKASKK